MMKFAILLALVATAIAEPIPRFNLLNPTGRINGGVATSIEAIPHQVSIQAFGVHICSGSIISQNWVLTAAHCFLFPAGWYTVRSGTAVHGSGGTVSTIVDTILHEQYTSNWWGVPIHDIALVRVDSLTFGSVQAPISLYAAGQELAVGTPVVITGWGRLVGGFADVLQTIMMPVVSKADCSEAYSFYGGIREGQMCAGVIEGLGECQPDGGGPVTVNGVLAGIVSWGSACARPGYLGVYTEVSVYRAWITTKSGSEKVIVDLDLE